MSFTQRFGGTAIVPAQPSYEALTIAVNTVLVWPLETTGGVPYVAAQIDVTANTGGLELAMPPADQGSSGVACVIANVGANSFTVTDSEGTAIQTIAASQEYVIVLTDNSDAAGAWRTILLGATTSSADAAALAGAGLEANAGKLRVTILTQKLNVNSNLTAAYRCYGVVWNGAAGTLQLDAVASMPPGWWAMVSNQGTGALVIDCTGGDTINGVGSLTLPEGSAGQFYSTMIVCGADGFYAYSVPTVTPISGGGTGATTEGGALISLGGTSVGIAVFTAPNAAAARAALGISTTFITYVGISTNTSVGTSASGTAYHASATLTLSLPITTSVTPSFFVVVDAHGGQVTISPNGADAINGQAVGANYIISQGASLMMITDAAGNWWPVLDGGGSGGASGIPWAVAGGTPDLIAVTYTPAIVTLTDGLLLSFRASGANTVSNPAFAPSSLTAHAITKWGGVALTPGDIPGNLAETIVRYHLASTNWELLNPVSPAHAPQMFINSGTYTTPSDTRPTDVIEFILISGGGGGGGASTTQGCAGSGGGTGGIVVAAFTGFLANAAVTITVGNGGTAGAAGSDGSIGGSTTIAYNANTVVTVTGGSPGRGEAALGSGSLAGGAPGSGSIALGTSGLTTAYSLLNGGAPGNNTYLITYPAAALWNGAGPGGSTIYGAGGSILTGDGVGSAGAQMGGGGGGAFRNASNNAGGAGGKGGVIVRVGGR